MKANQPELFKNFKWAQYPAMSDDEPSHVTIGAKHYKIGSSAHLGSRRRRCKCVCLRCWHVPNCDWAKLRPPKAMRNRL